MSGRFSDADLRSMLETRASRAHPASPEELAAVLAPGTTPWPRRRVALDGAQSMRWAVVPLTVLAVVVIGGVALVGRPVVGPGTASPGVAGPSAPAVESPNPSLAETFDAVRLQAFLLDLKSGDLDDRLVIATGQLEMLPTRCLSADPPGCFRLRFQGRDDPEIIRDNTLGTTRAAELIALDPAAHPLAFRVDSSHRLVLLGALRQEPGSPLVPADLASDNVTLSRDELAVVRGVLVGEGAAEPCPSPPPRLAGCPLPSAWLTPRWPRLSDAPPFAGGVGVTTRGADDLVGPYPDARSATFLVEEIRQFGGQYVPWNIVGQVDAPTTVWLTITPP